MTLDFLYYPPHFKRQSTSTLVVYGDPASTDLSGYTVAVFDFQRDLDKKHETDWTAVVTLIPIATPNVAMIQLTPSKKQLTFLRGWLEYFIFWRKFVSTGMLTGNLQNPTQQTQTAIQPAAKPITVDD